MKRFSIFLSLILLFLIASCASAPRYRAIPGERGTMVASWYGPKFHGRRTASGEVFDMYSYTAAHKTLPFGTRLRIINPENGRSVVVKINDRGPFVSGRDIDLSYAAARDLGLLQKGTSRVYVEYLGRDTGYVKTVRYAVRGTGPYTVQVGSFRQRENAWRLKRALSYSYRHVQVIKKRIRGVVFYRVLVGRFNSLSEAERVALRLTKEGYNAILTRYEEVL